MSDQTQAISEKLNQLAEQIEKLKADRNTCVVALAAAPGDRATAKKFADLNISIPKINDEIAAYESALEYATARDKADHLAADIIARRKSAAEAVQRCKAVAAINHQIAEIQNSLSDLVRKRAHEREECRLTALRVVSLSDNDRDINRYVSRVGIISTAVASDHAGVLQERLNSLLAEHEQTTASQEAAA